MTGNMGKAMNLWVNKCMYLEYRFTALLYGLTEYNNQSVPIHYVSTHALEKEYQKWYQGFTK